MKKFVAVMAFLLVMCVGCYGAEQYEIKTLKEEIKAVWNEIKVVKKEFRAYVNILEKEMQRKMDMQGKDVASLTLDFHKMAGTVARLSQKIDNLETRFKDLRSFISVCLFLIVISLFPTLQRFVEWRDSRKQSVTPENTSLTAEDVKRLIQETLAEMKQHGA